MTRAYEIIQALIERSPPRPPLERTTRMPYGWALWLRALKPLPAHPHAAPAEVVDLLAQRQPSPIPPGEELATWPAFFSLFRQGWLPSPRDERTWRWTSGLASLLLHLLFVVFLAWLAYLQSLLPPPPPEEGGGERIEVGFVGAGDPGTPRAAAADAPAGPAGETAEAADPAPAPVAESAEASPPAPSLPQIGTALPEPVLEAPALPEVAVREVPEPVPAEPAVAQPVQVTEVEQPTIDYVLPPTTPSELTVRPIAEPQIREREVTVVQAPTIEAPQVRLVDVPVRQPREAELRMREIDEPLPQVQVRPVAVQGPRIEARPPGAPEASVRQREVAMPSPAPSESASAAPATGTAPSGTGQDPAPRPSGGQAPGSASPATAAAAPGAGSGWESPRAGDDWGQARSGEIRPGGAPGLFDSEGRVRLPGDGDGQGPGQGPASGAGAGVADRGAPGGENDTWTRDRIDQAGTWLKRPPYDYEPTSFDRYWVPNESLLAEWVRKGIKSVAIPIPGTGKKIDCVVSMLQLGFGCGISDPDLNEQPTTARPPPDIPFKPELQEDNGSVPL